MALARRAVLVHRRTEYEELVDHHGTVQQAEFFLRSRDRSIDDVRDRHDAVQQALTAAANAVPVDWRQGRVERSDLARFQFDPEDVVVVVGQDGLVANVAKYLDGQPVIGVNAEPTINPGVLVPSRPGDLAGLLAAVGLGTAHVRSRTMVRAELDDGQCLDALNEIFVGHASHQSARYVIEVGDGRELQSSSGVLCGTGTGCTGWLRSAWHERGSGLSLPDPAADDLLWFVREAWPSAATSTELTSGLLPADAVLRITSQHDHLVLFGDGMEGDAVGLAWGQQVLLRHAERRLNLVMA
jgi:NAD kinase